MPNPDHFDRARQYLSRHGHAVKIKEFLGEGTDGAVWSTDDASAIKVYHHERGYFNECDSYERLARFGVTERLNEFWIPAMRGFDDDPMIVEMDLMQQRPSIIDFAKVKIDRPPEFSEEVLQQLDEDGVAMFGDNWPAVQSLMTAPKSYQIYYLDPKPHNIVFPSA
jgi:hypothetical protein